MTRHRILEARFCILGSVAVKLGTVLLMLRSLSPFLCCLLWALLRDVAAGPAIQKSWDQAILQTESILRKGCGEECVKVGPCG